MEKHLKNVVSREIVSREAIPTTNEPRVNAINEIEQLLSSGVDTLKYTRKTGTIVATKNSNGEVSTIKRRLSTIGEITQMSNTDVSDMPARNNYIVELYSQGYKQAEIAEITGLSPARIRQILVQYNAL